MSSVYWPDAYLQKRRTPDEAISALRPGQRVFIGTSCGEPQTLVKTLATRCRSMSDLEIIRLMSLECLPLSLQAMELECEPFTMRTFYLGSAQTPRLANYKQFIVPINLSMIPRLFLTRRLPIHEALIQVSPPDDFGWMSLGISVDITLAAAQSASMVIAQVNPRMPRVLGRSFIHVNDVDLNKMKEINRGQSVASTAVGTENLYEFINDNPGVTFYPSNYVNNPSIIAQHNNMVAINTALSMDLSGQAAADALPINHFTGVSGMMDFIRGAWQAERGKSIIIFPATTEDGLKSRIVPVLEETAVTVPRSDIHYVVTEYGAVNLFGKTLEERALALTSIAHPDFRDELFAWAREHGLISTSRRVDQGLAGKRTGRHHSDQADGSGPGKQYQGPGCLCHPAKQSHDHPV